MLLDSLFELLLFLLKILILILPLFLKIGDLKFKFIDSVSKFVHIFVSGQNGIELIFGNIFIRNCNDVLVILLVTGQD